MRSAGLIVLVVLVAVVGAVYVGGTLQVAGRPIFEHLDSALGTTFFMGCYYKFAYMIQRHDSPEEDGLTKAHEDFEKVLDSATK